MTEIPPEQLYAPVLTVSVIGFLSIFTLIGFAQRALERYLLEELEDENVIVWKKIIMTKFGARLWWNFSSSRRIKFLYVFSLVYMLVSLLCLADVLQNLFFGKTYIKWIVVFLTAHTIFVFLYFIYVFIISLVISPDEIKEFIESIRWVREK